MSYRNLLIHTCTIQANTGSTRDSSGHKVEVWSDLATSVPCRYTVPGNASGFGREFVQDKGATVMQHSLFLRAGQTITEQHRVTDVTDANGTTLLSQGDVESVVSAYGRRAHHRVALLKDVRT